MDDTQTVIVYKSKTDQLHDEASVQFMREHPNVVMGVHIAFFGFFILIFLTVFYQIFIRGFVERYIKKNKYYRGMF